MADSDRDSPSCESSHTSIQADAYHEAVQCILAASRVVAYTGAGMSADSGVETFRGGSNSTWSGITGMIMLAYGGTPFGWNLTPGFVWSKFVSNFYQPIANAKPHPGYYALSKLANQRYHGEMHVITMNVDGFHQDSGTSSEYVHEVHGSIRRFRCGKCSASMTETVGANPTTKAVLCTACNKGYARPDATLFTEALPSDAWTNANQAVRDLMPGDVMLVIGTSSVVYPAAYLPEYAKERGAIIIEINPSEETPLVKSKLTNIHIKAGAAEALTKLSTMIFENASEAN